LLALMDTESDGEGIDSRMATLESGMGDGRFNRTPNPV
jgi:hypothetical protein